jgi:hypothetical protein
MRARTKALLFSGALITASLAYGNCRFHDTRYDTQCDHLPGICVYGYKSPSKSRIIAVQVLNEKRDTSRSLEVCFRDRCTLVSGIYQKGKQGAKSVGIRDGQRRVFFDVDEPVQVWMNEEIAIVKGQQEYFAREAAIAPLIGLAEIFDEAEALGIPCIPEGIAAQPEACSNSEACRLEKELQDLAAEANEVDGCRLENARRELMAKLESRGNPVDELFNSRIILEDIRNSVVSEQPASRFWKGWDFLFCGGLLGALALGISRLFRRKEEITVEDESPELVPLRLLKKKRRRNGDEGMDEDKRRKFEDEFDKLFEKLEKSKTLDECKQVGREWISFKKKVKV